MCTSVRFFHHSVIVVINVRAEQPISLPFVNKHPARRWKKTLSAFALNEPAFFEMKIEQILLHSRQHPTAVSF
jgi:hypothetical protein